MAIVTRVFSQSANPAAATQTRFYTAPVGVNSFTVLSQMTVYNNGAAGDFRVFVGSFQDPSGAAVTQKTKRYGPPAGSIPAGTTVVIPGRAVVNDGGWIEIYASHANFAFSMDAVETTGT